MVRLLICFLLFSSCLSYRAKISDRKVSNTTVPEGASESERVFSETVYPLLVNNCNACHDPDNGSAPPFATKDPVESHTNLIALGKVSYIDLKSSSIYAQIEDGHNQPVWAWTDVETAKTEMFEALKDWKPFMDQDLLSPSGVLTQNVSISSGQDISKDINGTNVSGKKVTINLNSVSGGLSGASISFDVYPNPDDSDYYQVEEIIIETGSNPVALEHINIHINNVLDKSNTQFQHISDVVSPNNQKKVSLKNYDEDANEISNQSVAQLRIGSGISSDTVMVSFERITVYD